MIDLINLKNYLDNKGFNKITKLFKSSQSYDNKPVLRWSVKRM